MEIERTVPVPSDPLAEDVGRYVTSFRVRLSVHSFKVVLDGRLLGGS